MNEQKEKLILEIDALLAEIKINSIEPESLVYWQTLKLKFKQLADYAKWHAKASREDIPF